MAPTPEDISRLESASKEIRAACREIGLETSTHHAAAVNSILYNFDRNIQHFIAARAWPAKLFRLLSKVFEDVATGIVDVAKSSPSPAAKLSAGMKMLVRFSILSLCTKPYNSLLIFFSLSRKISQRHPCSWVLGSASSS